MPPQLNIPGQTPEPQPNDPQEVSPPPAVDPNQPTVRSLRPAGEKPEDRPTQRVFSSYQTGAVPTVTTPNPTATQAVPATTAAVQVAAAHQAIEQERAAHVLPGWVFSVIGGVSGIIITIMMAKMGMLDGLLGISEDREKAVLEERARIVDILETDGVEIEIYEGFAPE